MESVVLLVAVLMFLFGIFAIHFLIQKLGEFIWLVFEIKEDYDDVKSNNKVK